MDDNSLSIDLRKARKNLPPPPIPVAPLNIAPVLPAPPKAAPVEKAAPALAPKPRMKLIGKFMPLRLKRPSKRHVVFAVIVLAILGAGYYIYGRFWSHSPFGPTQPTATAQTASTSTSAAPEMTEADIIERVGKLILLPADETPSLAKVSDPAALQNQAFFKNAVTGDVVLLYAKALRAILYNPTQNKIIEIGPITDASSTTETKS